MSLVNLRHQSFPVKTEEDWKVKAEESLKGKSIESLKSDTYENIILKPLYSSQDQKTIPDFPGGSDFRRGIYPLGFITNNWKVAQRISYQTVEELKDKLLEAIDRGQTALSLEVSKVLFEKKGALKEALGDLISTIPFAVNAKGLLPAFLEELLEGNSENITGYIGDDPVALFAEQGIISEKVFTKWLEDIKLGDEKLPKLRTILVNSSTYHNAGANAVQELGIAAATGAFYLHQLLECSMKLEDILEKIIFQFSISSNFFMELAKIRAARILWNKITEVYGAKTENRGMHIAVETSHFTKTIYDSHVNILRAGNEAFAAVLGGVQYLHVTPFDEITGSSPLSERIARNTQNILKEEAHLQKVVDPAGGSWYIESLTTELAEKAWQYFQQIEAKGGIMEVLKTGWLQEDIASVNQKRKQDIFTRKQSIVGTNVYANIAESASVSVAPASENYLDLDGSAIPIKAVSKHRLSEPFEYLRKVSLEIERKSDSKPRVGMICLGELKQYKPRLDFVRGFFAAGGLQAVESGPLTSFENAKQFIDSQDTSYFCLCGSNDQYELQAHEMLTSLKKEFPNHSFYLAGLPDKEVQPIWMDEGIKQFIHLKTNCYETLLTLLTEMEAAFDEVPKA